MTMLFLLQIEVKGPITSPLEEFLEGGVKSMEVLQSFRQQGKILAGGWSPVRRWGCFIFNVDSAEELSTLMGQLPLLTVAECEVAPLNSMEFTLEMHRQALAQVRASK
jgi:muconolactone D-isomerase